jgi:hypothetical protein
VRVKHRQYKVDEFVDSSRALVNSSQMDSEELRERDELKALKEKE